MNAWLYVLIALAIAQVVVGIALILTYYPSLRKSDRTKMPFTNEVPFGLFLGFVSTIVGILGIACLCTFWF